MTFDQRFEKVKKLILVLRQRQDQMIAQAALDLQFAAKDTAHELDLTLERLETFIKVRESLAILAGSGRPWKGASKSSRAPNLSTWRRPLPHNQIYLNSWD